MGEDYQFDNDSDERPRRRGVHFDGTINLGHVLTGMGMLCALLTMWTSMKVTSADHEARLKLLETSNAQLVAAEQSQAQTMARLTTTIEFLSRK